MAYTITEKTTKILLAALAALVLLAFAFWGSVAAKNGEKARREQERALLVDCMERTDNQAKFCYDLVIAR